jgi:uncharacterized protein (DUF2141 family)
MLFAMKIFADFYQASRLIGIVGVLAFAGLDAASAVAASQTYNVTVDVSGLRNYRGHVVFWLWSDRRETFKFPTASKVQKRDERGVEEPCNFEDNYVCRRVLDSIQNLRVSYTFRDVPAGDYAIFIVHDENGNNEYDKGLFSRPLEGRGYSSVLPEELSPLYDRISFRRAKVTVDHDLLLTIGLRYPPKL